jgi:hypothetical protein
MFGPRAARELTLAGRSARALVSALGSGGSGRSAIKNWPAALDSRAWDGGSTGRRSSCDGDDGRFVNRPRAGLGHHDTSSRRSRRRCNWGRGLGLRPFRHFGRGCFYRSRSGCGCSGHRDNRLNHGRCRRRGWSLLLHRRRCNYRRGHGFNDRRGRRWNGGRCHRSGNGRRGSGGRWGRGSGGRGSLSLGRHNNRPDRRRGLGCPRGRSGSGGWLYHYRDTGRRNHRNGGTTRRCGDCRSLGDHRSGRGSGSDGRA